MGMIEGSSIAVASSLYGESSEICWRLNEAVIAFKKMQIPEMKKPTDEELAEHRENLRQIAKSVRGGLFEFRGEYVPLEGQNLVRIPATMLLIITERHKGDLDAFCQSLEKLIDPEFPIGEEQIEIASELSRAADQVAGASFRRLMGR